MPGDLRQHDNPFPGLRPFRTDEHHLFFGREEQTSELLRLLREQRFTSVVGTSGSGKSSLVRAGLIPALHRGTMAQAGSAWEVVVMRPGGNPITSLARALIEADLYDPEDAETLPRLRATLSRSRFGLLEAVRQSDEIEPGTNLLVVVDQFEELFRFRQQSLESEETAAAFVNLLLAASESETERIYVAITMRSDYIGDCSDVPGLAEAVNRGEYLIPRLLRDQKRDAIEKPVGVGGAKIAERLVQRMLNQVGDDPDQLPVLQHALMRTWGVWAADHADGEPIDLRHFEATGGMDEALSRHADEVFEALPDHEHRNACERIFKALTEKGTDGRGIRRPTRLDRLESIAGTDRAVVLAVLEAFRRPGVTFLMPGAERDLSGRTVVDLSHESLMRVWRRLRAWVDEEAQSARIYRRLSETAALWKEGNAGLYRDPDLQIALSWRAATHPNEHWAAQYGGRFDLACDFLDRSRDEAQAEEAARESARRRELEQAKALAEAEQRRAAERDRAAKRLTALVACLAVVAVAAVVAFLQARAARREADVQAAVAAERAEEARRSAALAAQNEIAATKAAAELRRILVRSDFNQGAQSIEAGNAAEGLAFLGRALRSDPDYAPAGVRAMSTLASGRFRLREYPVIEQDRPITDFEVNRHEELILTSDEELVEANETPERFVFDLRNGERLYQVAGGAKVTHVKWALDGKRLYGVGEDRKTVLGWDARTGVEVWRRECELSIQNFDFALGHHPTLGPLASVRFNSTGEIEVFSIESGAAVAPRFSRDDAPGQSHGFSPDGTLHWSWYSNGVLVARESATGRVLLETQPRTWSWRVWFTADNGWLVALSPRDRAAGWWPVPRLQESGAPDEPARESAPEAGGWIDITSNVDARLLPSGRRLAIYSRDGAQRRLHIDVHDLATREKTASFDLASSSSDRSPGRFVAWRHLEHAAPRQHILRFPIVAVIEEVSQNSVAIWDLESGGELQRIRTPWFLRNAEITPDGMRLATVSIDQKVMIWDIASGTMTLPEPLEHKGAVTIAFSPSGTQLLTSVWPSAAVEFRDSRSGERLLEPLHGQHFGRDGALFSSREDRVALYQRVTTSSATFRNRPTEGRFVVVDAARRPIVFEPLLAPSRSAPGLVAYTPGGREIVVAGRERATDPGQLLIVDASTSETMRAITLPEGVVAALLALTPDGRFALLGTSDAHARLVELETGAIVRELALDGAPSTLSVSSDGRRAAMGTSGGKVHVFDLASGAPVGSAFDHGTTRLNDVQLSADGSTLVSASEDYTFRIADAATGAERIPAIKLENVGLRALFLDSTHAVLVSFEDSIPVVDLTSGDVVHRLAHSQPCLAAALSPDGDTLATGGGTSNQYPSGEVRIWDWRTGRRLGSPLALDGQVRVLEFSGDGALLASGTTGPRSGAVRVWDIESGRPLTDAVRGSGPVQSISFDPTGTSVVAGWLDGSVRIVDLPPRSTPKPEWLPLLVESVTGTRLLGGKQSVEQVSSDERARGREELERVLRDGGPGDAAHLDWLRWFLAEPSARTINPRSRKTIAEYILEKSGSSEVEDLVEALQLAPSSGVVRARIALAILSSGAGADQPVERLRRYLQDVVLALANDAIELEPENPEVWVLRAELLEKLGNRDGARQAIARAAALQRSSSANVSYLTAVTLSRDGRWEEADTALNAAIESVVSRSRTDDHGALSAPLIGVLPSLVPSRAGFDVRDLRLPQPIPGTFEDFDRIAEGRAPAGWSCASDALGPSPAGGAPSMGDLASDATPDWLVLDADRHPDWQFMARGEPGLLDGRVPTELLERRVLYAAPRRLGSPRPERSIETPDFDLRGRRDVHVAFHSAHAQSEGSIAVVEYSIDGGGSWLPVAYFIDARDLEYDPAGAIDAVATFTKRRTDLPWSIDSSGALRGTSYGDFIRSQMVPELAQPIHGRRAAGGNDSKRIEVFRLPAADGASRVRVRFALAGPPGGPAWAIDRVGLYEIPGGDWAARPERLDGSSDPAVLAGLGLATLLGANAASTLSAALSPERLLDVSPAAPDFGAAQWIWAMDAGTSGGGELFRRTFELEKPVRAAYLFGVGDDRFEASLNGQRIASGGSSSKLSTAPVTTALRPGRNVLAVLGENSSGPAGLLLRLEISFTDGETREVVSDASWRAGRDLTGDWIRPDFDDSGWMPPQVLGPYGIGPWGRLFDGSSATDENRAAAALLMRRAARLSRDDPFVLLASAYVESQASSGLLERAFANAERAMEIRPLGPHSARVLSALWVARADSYKRDGNGDAASLGYELAHVLLESVSPLPDPVILGRLASVGLAAESRIVIPRGSVWKYLDDGPYPDGDWRGIDFDDSSWREGPASLGYGDPHVTTIVRSGPDPRSRRVTTHFRAAFELDDPSAYAQLIFRVQRDDGVVVWLNGQEVVRDRMPNGPIGPETFASETAGGTGETEFAEFSTVAPPLRRGRNVVAVELHQASATSSDLGFALELEALATLGASVPDFSRLHASEEALGVPSSLRALLWMARTSRLRASGDLERAEEALEQARRFDPLSPRISYEAALLDRLNGNDDSAYANYADAVRKTIAIKEGSSLAARLSLPAHIRSSIEPLITLGALGLSRAAQSIAESKTLYSEFEARALLRLAGELATGHEDRLAVASAWPVLDPEAALRLADEALAALSPAPATPRAIRERRDWLRERERALRDVGRTEEADGVLREILEPPPRPGGLPRTMVDLSAHYTSSFYDGRWHFDRAAEPSLRLLPETYRPRHGIDFDLRGVVQLNSGVFTGESASPANRGKDVNEFAERAFPDEVIGIPVGLRAAALHFLASTVWGQAEAGEAVARYVIHYDDGTTAEVPVRFAEDISDWAWLRDELDRERIAWIGRTGGAVRHLILMMMTWRNPSPEKRIESFDFASGKRNAAPFLVAVTATEAEGE